MSARIKIGHERARAPFNPERRQALKLLASGLAFSLASCGRPHEEIVPYVDMPERIVPGIPLKFATTLDLAGYGRGVIVTSVEGRPIKVEGNPRHPASLGATDVFAEAAVLSLYDPDRLRAVHGPSGIASWEAFASDLHAHMERAAGSGGAGLRIVTNRVTSPTLKRQLDALLTQFPRARWYRYEPVSDDAERAGAVQAFGRPLDAVPRFAEASVVLALDNDFLGPGPSQVRNARGFAQARRAHDNPDQCLRLYVAESTWSLTGCNADHRLALRPDEIRNFAIAVAGHLRGQATSSGLSPRAAHFARVVATDLAAKTGRAIVLAGPAQPPEVHALCHAINATLKAPIDLIDPVDPVEQSHDEALQAFAKDLTSGGVETLIIIGANPAYDTPGALHLAEAIGRVPFSACLTQHIDETAVRCRWRLPLSHSLESWSDLRAPDGAASIVQPLIRPLYDSRTAHELIAMLGGALAPSSYELVQATWREQASAAGFDSWWRKVLHDGAIPDTRFKPVTATAQAPEIKPQSPTRTVMLRLMPDASVWDGRYANNAWLQECPKPLTKECWGSSIALSPGDALRLGVADGDVVRISRGDVAAEAPAHVSAGQADGVIAATLGYGRTHAGAIGNGVGANVYPLRDLHSPWLVDGVTVTRIGDRKPVPSTQGQFVIEGEVHELLPTLSLAELARGPSGRPFADEPKPTLYPAHDDDTYAWAMVIDTSACIGCNACVVACQSENNVPVVGPEEMLVGRDMHWLRIDTYRAAPEAIPGFQPVPCMQCEHAPCEPVCPVAASVHDGEGLNVQVYNRCIGTRFCQSNCPYKVRRFNFFGYADGQEYANLGEDVVAAHNNPDVTVRQRGVMEKCTYCVQRISHARRTAEKDNRSIAEGEVITACQAACPTQAISFGDRNNPRSRVNALRQEPRHYELLGHLGTRPRTTYLARLTNPNPDIDGEAKS
jgi:molybdopterin-containing oxidoreductase family iron-sulfur binding subunit